MPSMSLMQAKLQEIKSDVFIMEHITNCLAFVTIATKTIYSLCQVFIQIYEHTDKIFAYLQHTPLFPDIFQKQWMINDL